MHELNLWRFIIEKFSEDTPVSLLCVLESNGSSPGRQGFKMAVTLNEMIGTIGGGIMEQKLVELARQMLFVGGVNPIVKEQFHNKSIGQKNRSGMICSGEQTVFLYPIEETDILSIKKIIKSLEENKNGKLILSLKGIGFLEKVPVHDFYFKMKTDRNWVYSEKTGHKNLLTIIGGGHCALAFSKLMSTMDFNILLVEDRPFLNTVTGNNYVHRKEIVKDYSQLKKIKSDPNNHFVVIMTFGYRTDYVALKAVLDKEFKYLGVLGSKSKIKKMFTDLKGEGVSEKKLKKIHAPIGIDIKSQTPEEIAISIAAEIIKVKNADYK